MLTSTSIMPSTRVMPSASVVTTFRLVAFEHGAKVGDPRRGLNVWWEKSSRWVSVTGRVNTIGWVRSV